MRDDGPDAEGLALRQVIGQVGGVYGFELLIDELVVMRGEAIALAGPSGSGKSTALNIVGLSLKPVHIGSFTLSPRGGEPLNVGQLWANDDDDRLTEVRGTHHGFVLQQGGLLPFLTVRQNIELSQKISGRLDQAYLASVAGRLGICGLLDRMPSMLSVGERQRAAIARSLAHKPDLVLADEPTASVHPALAEEILDLLVELSVETRTTVIASTHDPERAARAGFRVVEIAQASRGGQGTLSTLTVKRRVAA